MASKPESVNIIVDYGEILVVFPDEKGDIQHDMRGNNAVVECSQEDLIKWLKPFDGFALGNGVPQMEKFTIVHVKDDL